ncbi:MAG: hypothetical protein KKA64_02695 [Nanoarchaeota archaeon]|nr:hypothetical protein [Nanoarchaeota archaeon]
MKERNEKTVRLIRFEELTKCPYCESGFYELSEEEIKHWEEREESGIHLWGVIPDYVSKRFDCGLVVKRHKETGKIRIDEPCSNTMKIVAELKGFLIFS